MAMNAVERQRLREIMSDPIMWAQAFLKTFDPKEKR